MLVCLFDLTEMTKSSDRLFMDFYCRPIQICASTSTYIYVAYVFLQLWNGRI